MDHLCQETRHMKEPPSPGDLLHILTCPVCRDGMVHLLEQEARPQEEDRDDTGRRVRRSLGQVRRGESGGAGGRAQETRRGSGPLPRAPWRTPDGREDLLRTDRFRSPDLLDFLLDASYQAARDAALDAERRAIGRGARLPTHDPIGTERDSRRSPTGSAGRARRPP